MLLAGVAGNLPANAAMSSAFEKCVLFSLLTAVVFHTAGAQNGESRACSSHLTYQSVSKGTGKYSTWVRL